jgi:hypothetical protein
MAGHQHYTFEMLINVEGEHEFGLQTVIVVPNRAAAERP